MLTTKGVLAMDEKTPEDTFVYCCYCRYLNSGYGDDPPQCKHPTNIIMKRSWYSDGKVSNKSPSKLNKNMDCKNFVSKEKK